ncbi:MAG: class I SAM-dependent methyltransferase [Candidatus Methylumidiphilus sp.]
MTINCPVCGAALVGGLTDWHKKCRNCHYECSIGSPCINDSDAHATVDETNRSTGLATLRKANFRMIIEQIKALHIPRNALILDVGCAHGWFLELANQDFTTLGIEPDINIYRQTKDHGLQVRNGFFPDVLDGYEKFSLVVFNDVLEHIPDIRSTIQAVHKHLTNDGVMVVNIPVSTGFFYKTSKILYKFGIFNPFYRLWQVGFPSPHLHYFYGDNLTSLVEANGFELLKNHTLPSLHSDGIKERIDYGHKPKPLVTWFMAAILKLLIPVFNILPADIEVFYFKKMDTIHKL